ncbi:MAG: flavin reductase family protein [Phascolarctobacterium sp.]|nr:flavin reductase family protein [Phascolarctobacterium sp.]
MRKNFGPKNFIYPMPVLVVGTYDEEGKADAMTAAWGCCADYTKICLILDRSHKTTANILARKAFTVSMANAANVVEADFVGIVSANNDPDKLAKTKWSLSKSEFVDAPVIAELPLTLECTLDKWDEEREMVIGNIVNTTIDESILDEKGNVDVKKLDPITFDCVAHTYLKLGDVVAKAFNVGLELKK